MTEIPRWQFEQSECLAVHAHTQSIAKDTMEYLAATILKGYSAKQIKWLAETYMKSRGVDSFWYRGVGALVLVGEETTISVSGNEYIASEREVMSNDLFTVDLSPQIDRCWGDLARTFVVQDGNVIDVRPSNPEIARGMMMEVTLHDSFTRSVKSHMTLEEAYWKMSELIEDGGFQNLDFKKNLGHTIAGKLDERIYLESGNDVKFTDIGLFTFEPHIRKRGGKFGFKHENIYYFDRGQMKIL